MADLRAFLDVTTALRRLTLRHGGEEVVELVRGWVTYMDRVREIRWEVPDDLGNTQVERES